MRPLTIDEQNSKVEEEKQKLFLRILHKSVGTSQRPKGAGVPSNKKPNIKPREDDDEEEGESEPAPKIEVTTYDYKKIN